MPATAAPDQATSSGESAKEFLRRHKTARINQTDPRGSNEIEFFVGLLCRAIERVGSEYYGGNVVIESGVDYYMPKENNDRKSFVGFLLKHQERVFCYELYHQVRTLMDRWPSRFDGFVLQAELKKERIHPAVEQILRLRALDKEYFPDFLLHAPRNAERQLVVIEVKCHPNLSFAGIKDDLAKIQQFLERYKYQIGVFLTVNTRASEMKRVLTQQGNRQWIRKNLPDKSRIIFLCKESPSSRVLKFSLDRFPP